MINEKTRILMAAAALVVSTACSERPADPDADATAAVPGPAESAKTAATPVVQRQLDTARRLLAGMRGVDLSRITVSDAREVTWPSGALGCPEPDMSYTMALVPGVLIVLEVDGATFRFHGGVNADPFFCPPERAEAPAMGSGEALM